MISRPQRHLFAAAILCSSILPGCHNCGMLGKQEPVDKAALAAQIADLRVGIEEGRDGTFETCTELGDLALTLEDDEAAAEIAWVLLELDRQEEAATYIDRARRTYPASGGHKLLCFPEAALLEAQGNPVEAAEAFAGALQVEPVNPFEYSGAADLWVAADRFDDAAAVVDKGLERFPGDLILLQAKAEVALRRGQTDAALSQLDELFAKNPEDVGVQILRMEALAVLDHREQARTAAVAFEEAYPILGHGSVILGLVEARMGNREASIAAWDRTEEMIAVCEECSTDLIEMLRWAREQATAETLVPLDR